MIRKPEPRRRVWARRQKIHQRAAAPKTRRADLRNAPQPNVLLHVAENYVHSPNAQRLTARATFFVFAGALAQKGALGGRRKPSFGLDFCARRNLS